MTLSSYQFAREESPFTKKTATVKENAAASYQQQPKEQELEGGNDR